MPRHVMQDKCQWFLKCGNDATTTMPHPILGDVPICDRCKEKVDAIEGASYQVRCEDGAIRHEGTFATKSEAKEFAWTGHICANRHEILTLREGKMTNAEDWVGSGTGS